MIKLKDILVESEVSKELWYHINNNISLEECYSIGDSPRDMDASLLSKCKPLGLRTGNGRLIENDSNYNIPMFNDLADAVEYVIKNDINN